MGGWPIQNKAVVARLRQVKKKKSIEIYFFFVIVVDGYLLVNKSQFAFKICGERFFALSLGRKEGVPFLETMNGVGYSRMTTCCALCVYEFIAHHSVPAPFTILLQPLLSIEVFWYVCIVL